MIFETSIMMKVILFIAFYSFSILNVSAQNIQIETNISSTIIDFNGKEVKAKKLVVSSVIPMHVDSVWANIITSDLLIFITKGYAKFKPEGGAFPRVWKEGDTVTTKTRIFGFLPFGGIRHLYFETVSDSNYIIQTREWDKGAKVWDHKITLEKTTDNYTRYTDEIVIYGRAITGLITSFAKRFYKHRQKRWQIVAKENLIFNKRSTTANKG